MVRSPHLCSHLLQYRRLMVLLLQASCPTHCYDAVQSAHKSLRVPLVMSQVMTCRSLKRSRSSHSLSSYSAAESQLLLTSRLNHQPISLQDAAVQTTPPCDVWETVSTQTSDQQDTLSCDVAVQTSSHGIHILSFDAAVQTTSPSTLSQHVSTQMGSRAASSFSVDVFVQTPTRSAVLHDVSTQLPITEFFIGCVFSNDPLDRQNFVRQSPSSTQDDIGNDLSSLTCTITRSNFDCDGLVRTVAPRALLQPPPGLEQFAPPPGLAIDAHLYTTHGASVSNAPPRVRLQSAISVSPPQPPACTIHVGSHHPRSATTGKRSASTAMAGSHILAITGSRAGSVPFPKPRPHVLPLVHFGQSKPEGYTGLDTADSDLMHHQYRPARKQPTDIVSAACGKFHAVIFRKPVIMFSTSLISLWPSPTTRTSLSCSTRTLLSLTL